MAAPNDHGRDDQPDRDPVGDLLEALQEQLLVDGVHLHRDLVVGDVVQDLVDPARQPFHEVLRLDQGAEQVAGRDRLPHAAMGQLRRSAPDRGVRVELRIQGAAHLVQVEQGLAQHRQLGRDTEPAVARDPGNGKHDLADMDLAQLGVAVLRDHLADPATELGFVGAVTLLADLDGDGRGVVAMPLADRHHELQQLLLQARADPRHHPDVQEGDASVLREDHVAGVGIGVDEPVDEDLLQVRSEQLVGQQCPVDVDLAERTQVRDLLTLDELGGQDEGGAVVLDDRRNHDVRRTPPGSPAAWPGCAPPGGDRVSRSRHLRNCSTIRA